MSRLLFAAARGARIMSPNLEAPLSLIWINNTIDHGIDYYIHPDDEHLQYGPISTALRDCAKTAPASIYLTAGGYALSGSVTDAIGWHHTRRYYEANELHRALFLLILAEALADEVL